MRTHLVATSSILSAVMLLSFSVGAAFALTNPTLTNQALALLTPAVRDSDQLYSGDALMGQILRASHEEIVSLEKTDAFLKAHPEIAGAQRSGADVASMLDEARQADVLFRRAHDSEQGVNTRSKTLFNHLARDAGLSTPAPE
jgi:hypothetical protein